MEPQILDYTEEHNILKFTINNINVSYANAIRRVILSDIRCIVFKTFPHEKNDANIFINTSRLNNEILKQRLACIPIHIDNLEISIEDYIVEIDVENTTDSIIYITTKDFRIRNIKSNTYLDDTTRNGIFPPDSITRHYIDFCRLRPRISDTIPGEHLKMSCTFSYSNAKENGSYNVVSTGTYRNSPNLTEIEERESRKEEELKLKYTDPNDVKFHLQDWKNLDAKRIYIDNSFDFKIETIGVFANKYIITTAINLIITRLRKIIEIYSTKNNVINVSDSTIPNSFDIILENEDYTIGKVLEYTLYQKYYKTEKTLTFCGFRKAHPHINISIIRVAFDKQTEKSIVSEYITISANIAIELYKKILEQIEK
jgi:DNA-directed RNA polymerase subunit L